MRRARGRATTQDNFARRAVKRRPPPLYDGRTVIHPA
jgi:hypothetical protein